MNLQVAGAGRSLELLDAAAKFFGCDAIWLGKPTAEYRLSKRATTPKNRIGISHINPLGMKPNEVGTSL